jgi:hypothetical protein
MGFAPNSMDIAADFFWGGPRLDIPESGHKDTLRMHRSAAGCNMVTSVYVPGERWHCKQRAGVGGGAVEKT